MRGKALLGTAVAAVAFVSGCEWTGSDGDTGSWNQNYDIVNFSATYRGVGGAAVAQSAEYRAPTVAASTTVRVANEHVATGNGVSSAFSGALKYAPVVAGSVLITAANWSFADDGAGHLVNTAYPTMSGSISYSSGGWSINTAGKPIGQGVSIVATYSTTGSGGTTATPTLVQTMTVSQTGEHLVINCSNGMVFTGQINGMDIPETVTETATIVAKYTVSSGSEKIVGTLTDTSTQRIINGSWVRKGETLDVLGYAGPATRRNVLATSTTAAATTGTGTGTAP